MIFLKFLQCAWICYSDQGYFSSGSASKAASTMVGNVGKLGILIFLEALEL